MKFFGQVCNYFAAIVFFIGFEAIVCAVGLISWIGVHAGLRWLILTGLGLMGTSIVFLLLGELPGWIGKLFAKKAELVSPEANPITLPRYHRPYRPMTAQWEAIRRHRLPGHRHRHSF